MRRLLTIATIYAAAALALEHGVLPLAGGGWGFLPWGEARLLGLGVVLMGCLQGETMALIYAVPVSLLAGTFAGEGGLGLTLVSYSTAGYAAGWSARWLDLDDLWVRAVTLSALMAGESLIASVLRKMFWPESLIDPPWLLFLVVGFVGSILYYYGAPALKRPPGPAPSIGGAAGGT